MISSSTLARIAAPAIDPDNPPDPVLGSVAYPLKLVSWHISDYSRSCGELIVQLEVKTIVAWPDT
jgi:hypothetical protein